MEDSRCRFVVEEEDEMSRYSKKPLFHWELTNTLEQLDFQIRFMSGLIYRVAQRYDVLENSGIRILRSLGEVADYIYQKEGDYILLTSPEYMPVVFKSKDIGWVKDPHEFANWLMVNWTDESLVIALISPQ